MSGSEPLSPAVRFSGGECSADDLIDIATDAIHNDLAGFQLSGSLDTLTDWARPIVTRHDTTILFHNTNICIGWAKLERRTYGIGSAKPNVHIRVSTSKPDGYARGQVAIYGTSVKPK